MVIWQGDFYKRSLFDQQGEMLWELVITDQQGTMIHEAKCPQSQANSDWLIRQLQQATQKNIPDLIQVFRPQSIGLLTSAAEKLGIKVVPTRRTSALKEVLKRRSTNTTIDVSTLDRPPPQGLPENLWGEQWGFISLKAGDLIQFFRDRPIPIVDMPEDLLPINLNLPSTVFIPGIVIYGGRKSMYLARWLEEQQPVSISYIPTQIGLSGGLVLESGLVDRWILATFEDPEMAQAAQKYEDRKVMSKGLHFLTVQPDDSGITYTGFWLLNDD
ncbi:protein of unknown function DUF1092 [Gloeothece citriformis PCC 7424]|uniref:DUF1092 family protein n=1 Tax=Gloeothece citriformis (strain PCC 7424) TaxID=65393 RepID=B7K871_GLOC7|nr:Tab2/Atab2 family RNA-binding protein [Gloeothece citriformis]ACK69831.1 protein of unknown function DUF1092 [Gloeothece citriformis PCC 7424]